jgi:hypothetical protein
MTAIRAGEIASAVSADMDRDGDRGTAGING